MSPSGCSDHQSSPARRSSIASGHAAPDTTHSRNSCLSSAGSGDPGGISSPNIRATNRLPPGSPGASAGPLVPPLSALARVERSNWPCCTLGPWHWMQRRSKISVAFGAGRPGAA